MDLFRIFLLLVIITGSSVGLVTAEVRIITPTSLIGPDPVNFDELSVDFSGAPTSGRAPLMVSFFDLTKGRPVKWSWDFGDGTSSAAENPVHTYAWGGYYSVRLTAYCQDGSSGSAVKDRFITARPVPLNANFTAVPTTGPAPLTVQFTDHSEGAMVWFWDFGDGSTKSMQENPTHTYSQGGTYTVQLKVSNDLGEYDSANLDITVSPVGKVNADFVGLPVSGPVPLTVQFTDRSTGTIASRLWDFGDGIHDTADNPVHYYGKSGVYPVTLTVYSVEGESDTERKKGYINVLDAKPSSGSITLFSGWNFVSIFGKLEPGKDTAGIFQHVDTDGHSAFQYDSTTTNGWIPLSRTSQIRPLEAIWVYSKKNDSVALTFDTTSPELPSRNLVKGWNAVGFTGFNPVMAKYALISVRNSWQNCIGFSGELQKYDEMIFKGSNDDTLVKPYGGYWLFMSDAGNLSGSSSSA